VDGTLLHGSGSKHGPKTILLSMELKVDGVKGNRNNEMVGKRDRANGPQDQHKWQPRRSIGSHVLPQKRQQWDSFAKTAQFGGRRRRFSNGKMR
jgi:hypothetical protein